MEEVKLALRIDYDDEDILLQSCMNAAESYLIDGVDNYNLKLSDEKFKRKAKIVLILIIQDMFDNRSYLSGIYADKVKNIVSSMINQMKYCEVVTDDKQT